MTLSLTLHCVIGVIEAGKKISTLRKLANYLSNWYSIAWDSLKDRWHLSVSHRYYDCNFESNLMKLCMVVWGRKPRMTLSGVNIR